MLKYQYKKTKYMYQHVILSIKVTAYNEEVST